jgi:leader peptidase (prepilin peptidase)/N-methyltransferase
MSLLAALLAAPALGSFAALAADRLPEGRGVVAGRSRCDGCGRALGPRDLVPILSFLALRGRARCCGAPIPRHLPLIEAAFLLVPLTAALAGAPLLASCALGWTLVALAAIDLRTLTLPDALTLPLIAGGLALAAWGALGPPALHAGGAAAGWALVWGIDAAYRAWRGAPGMGMGDAKLLAAAGAWCGLAALPSVLLAACLLGLVGALAAGAGVRTPVPFGPALAAAFWGTWLLGPLGGPLGMPA